MDDGKKKIHAIAGYLLDAQDGSYRVEDEVLSVVLYDRGYQLRLTNRIPASDALRTTDEVVEYLTRPHRAAEGLNVMQACFTIDKTTDASGHTHLAVSTWYTSLAVVRQTATRIGVKVLWDWGDEIEIPVDPDTPIHCGTCDGQSEIAYADTPASFHHPGEAVYAPCPVCEGEGVVSWWDLRDTWGGEFPDVTDAAEMIVYTTAMLPDEGDY